MHPYSSIDTTTAWKKLRFILSVKSGTGSFKNVIKKMYLQIMFLIYMHKEDLVSHNLQGFIFYKLNQTKQITLDGWYVIKQRNQHTHTHTHTHIYIYIYIYVCVCVCVLVSLDDYRDDYRDIYTPLPPWSWFLWRRSNRVAISNYCKPLRLNWGLGYRWTDVCKQY